MRSDMRSSGLAAMPPCFGGAIAGAKSSTPLAPVLKKIHINLKRALDPESVFNPGRMYHDL